MAIEKCKRIMFSACLLLPKPWIYVRSRAEEGTMRGYAIQIFTTIRCRRLYDNPFKVSVTYIRTRQKTLSLIFSFVFAFAPVSNRQNKRLSGYARARTHLRTQIPIHKHISMRNENEMKTNRFTHGTFL